MMVTIRMPAGPNTVFSQTAFDSQIGKMITVTVLGRSTTGVVLAVTVGADGTYADVTLDADDPLDELK